jgi:uncharacterized protein (TIGR04255 family)
LSPLYDSKTDLKQVTAHIEPERRKAEFQDVPQTRFASNDQTDAIVVSPDGLLWTRLAPYPGWDVFAERVARDLKLAIKHLSIGKPSRIGMRFINRIDVPATGDVVRYEDYLAINIDLPPQISSVDNYGWRFECPFPTLGLRAVLQSAVVEPEVPSHLSFLLDIDVIAMNELPADLDSMLSHLEKMRTLKNELFELSIRDKAREQFSR